MKGEFSDCIKIDDNIKEIPTFNQEGMSPLNVYLLFEKTSSNSKNLINEFISEKGRIININDFYFLFNINKIIEMNKAKHKIFIVNKDFLIKNKIDVPPIESSFQYYKINSRRFLYCTKTFKILLIESKNQINNSKNININNNNNNLRNSLNNNMNFIKNNAINNNMMNIPNNNDINNNIMQNMNDNNYLMNNLNINTDINGNSVPKINKQNGELILQSLILFYSNNKEIKELFTSSIFTNYNIKKYVLINKRWFDDLKKYVNYNEINKLQSKKTNYC